MKKISIIVGVFLLLSIFISQGASASPLSLYQYIAGGDVEVTANSSVRVGTNSWDANENDIQSMGIRGVAVPIYLDPVTGEAHVYFSWDLKTWDSYNAPGTSAHSGYFDSFSVTLTKGASYSALPLSDPVVGDRQDPNILDVATTFIFTGVNPFTTEEFGGHQYADGRLETSSHASATFTLQDPNFDPDLDLTTIYYINFILDTRTFEFRDDLHPSWGTYGTIDIDAMPANPVPIPSTIWLFGSGLLASFVRYRRKIGKR